MWCESLVHNSSYCLVIVQQSHSCLHQAVMVWPSACQSHWADKFDVIIPRQWTWSPVYGPCLCITALLSLRSVSWTHFENRACVCSCQFLLLCSCASVHIEGSMVNKRSAGRVRVRVCVCALVRVHDKLGYTSTFLLCLCCPLWENQITLLCITVWCAWSGFCLEFNT